MSSLRVRPVENCTLGLQLLDFCDGQPLHPQHGRRTAPQAIFRIKRPFKNPLGALLYFIATHSHCALCVVIYVNFFYSNKISETQQKNIEDGTAKTLILVSNWNVFDVVVVVVDHDLWNQSFKNAANFCL